MKRVVYHFNQYIPLNSYFSPMNNMRLFDQYQRYNLLEDRPTNIQGSDSDKAGQILVLCRKEDLIDANKSLLAKILEAIGESMDSTTIMYVDQNINLTEIINHHRPTTLLSFKVNLNKNGLNIHQRLYDIIKLNNMSIIISESLTDLNQNKEAKMRLWKCLKTHFAQKIS